MDGWSMMTRPEARLHAILKMSDLVLAWEVLKAFLGSEAWAARTEVEKVEISRISAPAATADSAAEQPMDTRAVPDAATPTSPTGAAAQEMFDQLASVASTRNALGAPALATAGWAGPVATQPWKIYDVGRAIDHRFESCEHLGQRRHSNRRRAAPPNRLVTLADVQAYLLTAGLCAVDVPGDGNCWLPCVGWHLPQAEGARKLTGDGTVRVQNCRATIQAFYDEHQELFNFDMAATCRPVAGRGGARESLSLTTILARKQQVDEPEFWHIIANMTGRVIQLYVSWPLEDMLGGIGIGNEEFPNNAPFAMEFICPHATVELSSREPLRFNDMITKVHAGIDRKSGMHASPGQECWVEQNFEIFLDNVYNKTVAFQPLDPLSQEHTAAKRLCSMWIKQKLRNGNTKWKTQCVLPDECRQNDVGEAKLCTGCAPKVTANFMAMLHFDRNRRQWRVFLAAG
ncbi:hypothetical protein CYMTET_40757 [Cymbomonas tetramitiformis]|uniref:Uncharacterized protein n=1 Tax=Cymbomonas tetramitiformis TaxID=36881 RepID=A0AAE0F4B2_9CHLO|nr:hypothetical protein CYMTET_40757 [Cymbomonas tetramitiformis]